jgi:excinuclease ABC subunit A
MKSSNRDHIAVRGARQNNLRDFDLDIPLRQLVVVTGVSGSGKSSLAFDTVYAEGQRRYVETFSPYARQFLDRMDKPQVDRIEGIPPAIAIDQTNPVRTSRSTVGTMTELNDHLKLLFARAARLYCRGCGAPVRRDSSASIARELIEHAAAAGDPRLLVTFPVSIPENFSREEVLQLLAGQGYTRVHSSRKRQLEIVQDRFRAGSVDPARLSEALESALRTGRGRVNIYRQETSEGSDGRGAWHYSEDLHCATCDIHYRDPVPSFFSFNSPLGACDTCRGFGRVIGVDYGLVIPDESLSLRDGAIRPWQTKSFSECQDDLIKFASKRDVPVDVPWAELSEEDRDWVVNGEGARRKGLWYGVKGFFKWLESKSYKMHVRVLLSKYRSYTPCAACNGARLKSEALLWRLGGEQVASDGLPLPRRYMPSGTRWTEATLASLPGLCLHDVVMLPIDRCRDFFSTLRLSGPLDEAGSQVLEEVRSRLEFLVRVGLGYLTLDRQSRTLSGGEVQRINLTTALGTSLVNTLFVLDEPSVGLHPRDMGRVIDVMQRLRDNGNSLLVVEHDPQVMMAADRIIDLGPGPGERGGQIVFEGTPAQLAGRRDTLTAQYLSGARDAATTAGEIVRERRQGAGVSLFIQGASEHNLHDLDIEIPLGSLVCVTGVSGSGKSTLVQDVLYAALRRARGEPTEVPGAHRLLLGAESLTDVVLVDQTPIGRTTRSNPASYVGAFDYIRKRFATEAIAIERGYTAGTFSFNSGNGRCPGCSGNGFEHVEMQFLSDVYLRCPDCNGQRYRSETLEVKMSGPSGPARSIADVLEMSVSEAVDFFAEDSALVACLEPLRAVGLDYLRLGQPVPTLSGGEAQRLKLAGHLAQAAKRASGRANTRKSPVAGAPGGTLFLFDEPTTGLHFDDVARLLRAFARLIEAGDSLVVIEHNLDVIRAADWIIDLGPEGGEAGGRLVVAGTPADVMACKASHTGQALLEYEEGRRKLRSGQRKRRTPPRSDIARRRVADRARDAIVVSKAREHNLRDVDVSIPRHGMTVVTGVSGSGKSTLAFDIVFAEGQRRYMESLNAYARQFVQPATRPDVDLVSGIPPTVAIEQRTSRGGRKSTVGTLTEIHHFLRLLYVKLGVQHCPDCAEPIEPQSVEAITARLMKDRRGRRIEILAPLISARKGYYTDLAKWAAGKGFDTLRVDGELLPTGKWPRLERFREHTIELPVATVEVAPEKEQTLRAALQSAVDFGKGVAHIIERGRLRVFSIRRACPSCGRSFAEPDPRLFSYNSRHGWCEECFGTGVMLKEFDAEQSGEETRWNEQAENEAAPCGACEGRRLNPVALNVFFRKRSISALSRLSVDKAQDFLAGLELGTREGQIARDILAEIRGRLSFLQDVGLGYISLDRAAPTLSGGEAQRIRLAAQLGSNLQGVCYVLDEPTIGLHPRDNRILLDSLAKLSAKGNALMVVEHDEDTIKHADHLIDLGPGAGSRGGRLVAQGQIADLMAVAESVTGQFLANPLKHPLGRYRPVKRSDAMIRLRRANLHNLRGVDARIPLNRLTAVTGVSGSGKSTLARDVLFSNLRQRVGEARGGRGGRGWTGCRQIEGWESIARVLEVDQTPIGKTPRSCPATYVGFWDDVRKLFAATTEARMCGYGPSRFSFNTAEGRCDACAGQGMQTIEMSFLPDVKVLCEECGGRRFGVETLAVEFRGRNAGDVLAMSVDEAVEFFAAHPRIHHALSLLQDVGLGYLTLGQQSPTLSGGEAQRIKLVTELARLRPEPEAGPTSRRPGRETLYVLDEPTVGLHMADVEKLVRVLHRLVDAGNTVVVIEHNLDVIAEADWIIDLGPEGGVGGGRIVAQGAPGDVLDVSGRSHTARILKEFLAARSRESAGLSGSPPRRRTPRRKRDRARVGRPA